MRLRRKEDSSERAEPEMPKIEGKAGEKDAMVDGVKSCRQVQEDEGRDFIQTRGTKQVVMDSQEGGLGGVFGPKGRLEDGNGGEGAKVVVEAEGDDAFKNFGEEVEVGYGAVV